MVYLTNLGFVVWREKLAAQYEVDLDIFTEE
jgi:hypothetical protein